MCSPFDFLKNRKDVRGTSLHQVYISARGTLPHTNDVDCCAVRRGQAIANKKMKAITVLVFLYLQQFLRTGTNADR